MSGSEYVAKLIVQNTAAIVSTSLNQAYRMMQEAVTPEGVIRDVDALDDVRKCLGIASMNLDMISVRSGIIQGTRIRWNSGMDRPFEGIIVRVNVSPTGERSYVVMDDASYDVFTLKRDEFEVIG